MSADNASRALRAAVPPAASKLSEALDEWQERDREERVEEDEDGRRARPSGIRPRWGRPLGAEFYERPVLEVAAEMIGCVLSHGELAGVIVETEAYHDSEPACHAYAGLTRRTSTLFGPPGRAYVYRSYGIHALFNAVCEREGVGAAVLVRALAPLSGLEAMRLRRGVVVERALCCGPGNLTKALGIELGHNGVNLAEGPILICERPAGWRHPKLLVGPRVGITKATELPWRFCAAGSEYVSRPRLK